MKDSHRATRGLVITARKQGWSVELRHGGHYRFLPPTGGPIFIASTPSSYRGLKNAIALLRKAGLIVDRH